MKVVINTCFGGFGLSTEALEALIGRGWIVSKLDHNGKPVDPDAHLFRYVDDGSLLGTTEYVYGFLRSRHDLNLRADPALVAVVEELGSEASSGEFAKLTVVEIPDGVEFEIDDYDGQESIHEVHRSWR